MRFTVDASVHLNALKPTEAGSEVSRALLETLHQPAESPRAARHEVFVPTLLFVEVAASVARIFDDSRQGIAMANAVWDLPHQFRISLDEEFARQAQRVAARDRLRGADAVYAAVAEHFGATLITRDRQQLERISDGPEVATPEQVMGALASA